MTIAVYMWCGLCAAIAGLIVTADIRGADANNAGLWLELDAILAVVIGGTSLFGGRFSLGLSVVGALIIQAMNTGILLSGFKPEYNLIVKALVVLGVLLAQSPVLAGLRRGVPVPGARGLRQGRTEDHAMMRRQLPLFITIAVFLAGYAICLAQFPSFASTRVIANLLTDNAFLGIVAVGMTFVIISGGIDLSVGSVIAFTGVFIAIATEHHGIDPWAAFALILGLAAGFGAGMGYIIHTFQIPAFIVTLAGMFLARGLSFVLTTDSIPINAPLYGEITDMALILPGEGASPSSRW